MITALVFTFGLIIGSFLNVVIVRSYEGEGIGGRSRCPSCRRLIAWYDNIPLVSFLALRGRCRHCHRPISWQYPLIELATALLFVLVWQQHAPAALELRSLLLVARDLLFAAVLLVIFVQDARWYVILDAVSIPALVIAALLQLALGSEWQNLLFGAAVGAGFFLIQFLVSRGRWVGDGDIRLGALMGVMLGFPTVGVALLLAYVSGAIVGSTLVAVGEKGWSSQLPFGTFLAPATFVTLLWGTAIVEWYMRLL